MFIILDFLRIQPFEPDMFFNFLFEPMFPRKVGCSTRISFISNPTFEDLGKLPTKWSNSSRKVAYFFGHFPRVAYKKTRVTSFRFTSTYVCIIKVLFVVLFTQISYIISSSSVVFYYFFAKSFQKIITVYIIYIIS